MVETTVETAPLLETGDYGGDKKFRTDDIPEVTRVYTRRWGVMIIFVMFGCCQALVWNTWAPIAAASEALFGWTDSQVATIITTSEVTYLLFVIPVTMITDAIGLRYAMIICSGGILIGTTSRCFSLDPDVISITVYVCAFFQGTCAPLPFGAPALLSAIWFPPNERHIATATAAFFNYVGFSLSFLFGPQLVPEPLYTYDALDNVNSSMYPNISGNKVSNSSDAVLSNADDIRDGIKYLMYLHVAWAALTFVLTVAFFPAKPPLPPSITASHQRTDYKRAMPDLVRNGSLWLIILAGAIPIGVVGVWAAILDVILKPIGVSQKDAGWIGFWHALIGCLSGIAIAKFSDFFHRRRKVFLMILFLCAIVCSLWFALQCIGTIPYDLKQLYASGILIGILLLGTAPLFYEMCAEASYPVSEGVTGGFYTLFLVLFGVVFLAIASSPGVGTAWMNWAVPVGLVVAIPLLLVFPERYKRTDIDLHIQPVTGVKAKNGI